MQAPVAVAEFRQLLRSNVFRLEDNITKTELGIEPPGIAEQAAFGAEAVARSPAPATTA